MEKMVVGLIKIGEAKYQRLLYEKGEIYMQTLNYFRNIEGDNVRKDRYEGADQIHQVNWIKIADKDKDIEFSIKDGSMSKANYYSTPQVCCNAYCMLGITEDDQGKEIIIDDENMKFGDYFIFIYNVKEFVARICAKLDKMGFEYNWRSVKYYDEYDFEGRLSPFFKRKAFEKEKEVRIIAYPDFNGPLKIDIGSISDIAKPLRIEKLKTIKLMEGNKFEIS